MTNNRLQARSMDEEEDEDDDEEDEADLLMDEACLGDWRKFRASLIEGSSSSSSGQSNQQSKPKESVAAQNEALLAKQNAALADEYRAGVWAHTVGQPEVGGLLCRMPLAAEIYNSKKKDGSGGGGGGYYWKEKLDLMLGFQGESSRNEKDEEESSEAAAVVQRWFATAERMVARELEAIAKSDKIQNGILNPKDLDPNQRSLMDKYMDYKRTWQEICLLLSHNPETGCSEAVVLNRPITKSINKNLATALMEGPGKRGKDNFPHDFADKVAQAFGNEAAVYMGGPHRQDEPALLIHGIPDLTGAREIAPGTGIFQGGWEAAVEGVLAGTYQPLDFRFFIGRQTYDPTQYPERGALIRKVQDGAYQPLACARSLALKQCLGLPKPLWHEVLELCGGELKEISTIELRKRVDLQQ